MLTDWEAVFADFNAYLGTRPNHGTRFLREKLLELAVEHRVDESAIERLLRRYGVVVSEDLRAAIDEIAARASGDDPPDLAGESRGISGPVARRPGHQTTPGGRDGRRTEGERAAA